MSCKLLFGYKIFDNFSSLDDKGSSGKYDTARDIRNKKDVIFLKDDIHNYKNDITAVY